MRSTNAKFRRRFSYIERNVARLGKTMQTATLDEMEQLWQEAKRLDPSEDQA